MQELFDGLHGGDDMVERLTESVAWKARYQLSHDLAKAKLQEETVIQYLDESQRLAHDTLKAAVAAAETGLPLICATQEAVHALPLVRRLLKHFHDEVARRWRQESM